MAVAGQCQFSCLADQLFGRYVDAWVDCVGGSMMWMAWRVACVCLVGADGPSIDNTNRDVRGDWRADIFLRRLALYVIATNEVCAHTPKYG